MPKALLVTLATLAVAVGTAATWASAGSRQPSSTMAGMKGMKMEVTSPALAAALSKARVGTVKYVTNLNAAKAAGYSIITKGIPDMGWHFLNGKITGFDPARPPILVYEKTGSTWQLGALEWVFTAKPKTAPLPGARYGAFPAACHYADGTFVAATSQDACAATAPGSGAKFTFWHPNLVTLHVWLWYPNPAGLFSGTNPLVTGFDHS